MLKEIFEQPESLCEHAPRPPARRRGDARASAASTSATSELKQVERIIITACGTSWHAALIGEYMIEEMARIPVEVEYACEFRYRNPIVDERTLVIAICQSGETADTLAALREAKRRGARTLGVVNVVGTHDRARGRRRHLPARRPGDRRRAAPRRSPARWRALALVTLLLARLAEPEPCIQGQEIIEALRQLPEQIEQILEQSERDRADRRRASASTSELPVPRPRLQLPGRARGRAQAQGNQLHPRRGLSGGGDEARTDRADRREHAGRLHRAAATRCTTKIVSNIEEVKARGGQRHRGGHRRRHGDRAAGRPRVYDPRRRSTCSTPMLTRDPAAAAGVLRRRCARVQRGSAAESRQVRDGRVTREGPARRTPPPAGACSSQATALERSSGCDHVWPTSVMTMRHRSLPAAVSRRRIGSSIGSRLSRKVEWWIGSR